MARRPAENDTVNENIGWPKEVKRVADFTTRPAVFPPQSGGGLALNSVAKAELGEFLKDRCRLSHDAKVSSKDLYVAYTTWYEVNGQEPVGQRASAPKDRLRAVAQSHGCHRHLLELTSRWACDTKVF